MKAPTLMALLAGGLHEKSDIAAELAWRDKRIDELEREVMTLQELLGIGQ